MNKIALHFFLLLLLPLFLQAKIIDGIAFIVEGEAVTTTEIRAVQTQMQVSKDKAIELLIQDRLQKVAMKDISISEESIDNKVSQIAAQNNVSIPKMQKILKAQGTSWVQYRNSIKEGLKKERFYQEEVVASTPTPTEDELKLYYKNRKEHFVMPTSISTVEYASPSEEKMKTFLRTHNKRIVSAKKSTKQVKNINRALLGMLLQTPNGGYTQSINAGDKYICYKVLSKNGKTIMPFETAKGAVESKWRQEQQSKLMKDYFEKLRTRTEIEILR